jgi:hypothetical protein
MSKSPNWTVEEVQLLKEIYPTLGRCNELQKLFPSRNLDAITLKASRLGLKVINNPRIGRTNFQYIELLENTNFIAMEEYRGSTTPILHMCGICEHEWLARPQQLLRIGAKCPVCSHKTRFNSVVGVDYNLSKSNLTRLSDYVGSLDKLLVKHNSCDYEWWTVYSYIQQGSGCPKCNRGFGYKHNIQLLPDLATLYLFKISVKEETFLKVGITCRPLVIRQRELISSIGIEFNPVLELLCSIQDTGKNILDIEWNLLNKYEKYRSKLRFDGYTELLQIKEIDNIMKEINNYGKNI